MGKTVDSLFTSLQLPHIHYLKSDTEGFDAKVIMGASKALKAQKIDVWLFEYHTIGPWATTKLKGVVDTLDASGYNVWMVGGSCFIQVNGAKWDERFEQRQWSNCVATKKTGLESMTTPANGWGVCP